MKSTTRIATAAFALALLAAPATFADEGKDHPQHDRSGKQAKMQCACTAPRDAAPSAPEVPVFTDQG